LASIKVNIVSNLLGKVWGAAISILMLPLYIKYLGIESYGLVGFYATLIGTMAILDMGLSTTLNRELAKYKVENKSVEEVRDLTFSLECIYWLIGLVIGAVIVLFSGLIATRWVKVETLPTSMVKHAVMLMGMVVSFQWPVSLYNGGLTGLEKQIVNNVITVVMTTLRAAGVIIVLKFISATIDAFFLWQAALSLLYVLTMRWGLWRQMPGAHRKPKFSILQIKIIWRFAAGMTSISIVSFLLSQIDKIVLSKMLPLSQFGYYTLAYTLATTVNLIVIPVSETFFPRLANLVASNNEAQLKTAYHQACRLMAVLIFPFCLVLLFFTEDVAQVLFKNAATTSHVYVLTRIVLIGSIFNALMVMPYNLIVANGWTKFTIIQNLIAAILLIPLLLVLTKKYGAIGATSVWVIVNTGYILISQPLMHRKLLKTELFRWYWKDTFLPMLPPMAAVILIKLVIIYTLPGIALNFITLAGIGVVVFLSSCLCMKEARQYAGTLLKGYVYDGHR